MSDTPIISSQEAARMQQASAYQTSGDNRVPSSKEKRKLQMSDVIPNTTLSSCFVNVLFTIGLADPRFDNQTKALSHWKYKGVEYNLYNPFRKGSKSAGSDGPVVKGVLRQALQDVLETTSVINDSSLLYLGKPNEIHQVLASAVTAIEKSCTDSLVIPPETILASLQMADTQHGEDEGNTEDEVETSEAEGAVDAGADDLVNIRMSDVVRVTSWLRSWTNEDKGEAVSSHEAVVHFYINAGAVYDSTDKLKTIRQLESILDLAAKSLGEEANISMLLAVNMSTDSLLNEEMLDLFKVLNDSEQFQMFTQRSLLENCGNIEFSPNTKKGVLEKLLNNRSPAGDILLVKYLGVEVEDSEEGSESGE